MNKSIMWIVVVVLILVGVVLLANRGQQNTQVSAPSTTAATSAPEQAAASPTAGEAMAKNEVTETGDGFDPATITIKAGETVTWTNKSGDTVSINSAPHPAHTAYPPLNLGIVEDGQSVSLMFDKSGTYGYHDHLNPTRTGKVVVE